MTTRKSALAAAATRRKMAHGAAMWQQYLDAATNGEVEAKEGSGRPRSALNPDRDYDVTLCAEVAQALIERAGIEHRDAGWVVPVEARPLIGDGDYEWTWNAREALGWALIIIASVDSPDRIVAREGEAS